ncbi:hypothetical protein [Massilia forsythiae]|uniref:hypothetical protein n=1 Tax=Massilia forsythiae TaxID=2728020 RepID=UPI001E4F6877|nr:hypothetical protein [Massilia forsythiae]
MRTPSASIARQPVALAAAFAAACLVSAALQPACAAPASAATAPPASHPLLGIWTLSIPQLGCSETYHFRGDGTTLVKSAQEISESEFTVDVKPSARGFYKLQDRIVKDNGKQDCSGEIMKVGTRATNFLRFHPSGARFVMCQDETMAACIGPFERMPGQGI